MNGGSASNDRFVWTPGDVNRKGSSVPRSVTPQKTAAHVHPRTAQDVKDRPVTASTAVTEELHGTLGEPGYHELHPGNRGKGLKETIHGGMLGSPDHTEAEHKESLAAYQDNSQDFNEWLRNRELPGGQDQAETEKQISTLNDLIDVQNPLKDKRTVYRGAAPMDLAEGDTFHDPGFSSASDQEGIAKAFALRYLFQGKGQGSVMEIEMPVGTRALQVGAVSSDDNEEEWIFPPGTQFVVTGVTDDGYTVRVVQ
jgi:hypothetical protein